MDSERPRLSVTPTGDPRVDEAIAGLSSLADMELGERPAVLETVHDRLREILGELGDAGRPGPVRPGEPGRQGEQGEIPAVQKPAAQQLGPAAGGAWGRRPGV